MERLYALVNPVTNKIIQFSQLEYLDFNFKHIETINGERKETNLTALCVPVTFSPDLINKTYVPSTNSFN